MNFSDFKLICPWKTKKVQGPNAIVFCSANGQWCSYENCAPFLAANMMKTSLTPRTPDVKSAFKPESIIPPIPPEEQPKQDVPWTPVIGEEVKCPHGIGKVMDVGSDFIQVSTYIKDRKREWGWNSVSPWPKK